MASAFSLIGVVIEGRRVWKAREPNQAAVGCFPFKSMYSKGWQSNLVFDSNERVSLTLQSKITRVVFT